MEGIHIVAFAEEDDPGRRLFSSFHTPSLKKSSFLCFVHIVELSARAGMGSWDASGFLH